VALAAAVAVPLASRSTGGGEQPVALVSLTAGSCFGMPSKAYVQAPAASPDGLLRQVLPAACTGTHRGEVIAQVAIDLARLPYDDLPGAAHTACRGPFGDYNPDFWALPPNVELIAVPPVEESAGQQSAAAGSHDGAVVTCVYLGPYTPLTGPLRADPSRLNAVQRRYLDAVRPYDEVSADGLDGRESIRNDQLTAWAREVAAAEQHMVDDLQRIGAPAGAAQQFAVVLDQRRQAVADWLAAGAETAPQEIHRRMAAARVAEHASMDPDQAVRGALGLATSMRPRGYSL
jgi:hypothetical protein